MFFFQTCLFLERIRTSAFIDVAAARKVIQKDTMERLAKQLNMLVERRSDPLRYEEFKLYIDDMWEIMEKGMANYENERGIDKRTDFALTYGHSLTDMQQHALYRFALDAFDQQKLIRIGAIGEYFEFMARYD